MADSVLDTALSRLALMAMDSNVQVLQTYGEPEVNQIDEYVRPAWLITDRGGDYVQEGSSAGDQVFVEVVQLELYGLLIGKGYNNEEWARAKELTLDMVNYLLRHPRLAFSNTRNLEDAPLPDLAGLMWTRIRREPVTLYGISGEGEERRFWGGIIRLEIRGGFCYAEVIINNPYS